MKEHSRCRVIGCSNKTKAPACGTGMFLVPKERSVFEQWVKFCGDSELLDLPLKFLKNNLRICERHFKPNEVHQFPKCRKLKKNALPTISDEGHIPLPEEDIENWRNTKHFRAYYTGDKENHSQIDAESSNILPSIHPACISPTSHASGSGSDRSSEEVSSSQESVLELLSPYETSTDRRIEMDSPPSALLGFETDAIASDNEAVPLPDGSPPGKFEVVEFHNIIKKRKASTIESSGKRCRLSVATQKKTNRQLLQELEAENSEVTSVNKILCAELRKVQLDIFRIQSLNNHLKALTELDNLDSLLANVVSPQLRFLLRGNIRNYRRDSKSRRWNMKEKLQALSIFKRSPKGYRYLCFLFSLPSVRTLRRLLCCLSSKPDCSPWEKSIMLLEVGDRLVSIPCMSVKKRNITLLQGNEYLASTPSTSMDNPILNKSTISTDHQ